MTRLLLTIPTVALTSCQMAGEAPRSLRTVSGGLQLPAAQTAHTGSLWPLAYGGLACLLAGVGMIVIGNRATGATLLLAGVLLAVTPGWLVGVLESVRWVAAAGAGLAILMAVAFLAHRLHRILKNRKGSSR